ncbi:MAG: hypothetical protein AB7U43_07085, partial [Desulfobacter sp.]
MAEEKQSTKPEWMTQEDWEEIGKLPVSVQSNAIHLREKMIADADLPTQAVAQAAAIREDVAKAGGAEQTTLASWCGY